jgi:hypothetical protein
MSVIKKILGFLLPRHDFSSLGKKKIKKDVC